ncbi:hypothetical protein AMTRI_Chr11g152770 [Amborella trichopoda]
MNSMEFSLLDRTTPNSVISTTPNDLSNWSRLSSLWPLLYGTDYMNKCLMLEPKYVISMGACTSTGGMFSTDSYSTIRGVDKLIPVDVYLSGCPPKPETIIDARTKFHRIVSQQEDRCFTTNHKFRVGRSIHIGNYDQELLFQSSSTSEILSKTLFKYKSSLSSHELVN